MRETTGFGSDDAGEGSGGSCAVETNSEMVKMEGGGCVMRTGFAGARF